MMCDPGGIGGVVDLQLFHYLGSLAKLEIDRSAINDGDAPTGVRFCSGTTNSVHQCYLDGSE